MGLRWLACDESMIPAGTTWLHEAEARRVAGYRFTKRRREYLLRRLAGKRAAGVVLGLDVDDTATLARIGVLNRVGGAPYVALDGDEAGLELSLTDRAGVAVALVGPAGAARAAGGIGVDVEIVEARTAGFVRDFLTEREQRWVLGRAAGAPDAVAEAANLIWSAKESALKVQRVGLRADTRSVEVGVLRGHRADGWSRLIVDHAAGVYPGWWRRDGAFLTTVVTGAASEPPEALPGGVDLRLAVPRHSWLEAPKA